MTQIEHSTLSVCFHTFFCNICEQVALTLNGVSDGHTIGLEKQVNHFLMNPHFLLGNLIIWLIALGRTERKTELCPKWPLVFGESLQM